MACARTQERWTSTRPGARAPRPSAQLLLGHCDTVWPLGTLGMMPVEVKDGVIKGPASTT